ncbi:MAG: SDR family oxidoreductase [Thalassobaculum sp.]|uniref:SDR family oxidoreductase n=1 Tax=Thalassobaculum sp. TaxID=2022740 RepID=UPI0032EC3030
MTQRSRIAIVTGASRGIGRAIAMELAREGAGLVLAARSADALARVAEEAEKAGASATLAVAADLARPGEPERVVAAAVERFGGVDILVNNAGATKRGDFLTLSDADHLDGFALKYHATVRFCRAAWPHLVAAGGTVVNIAGIAAQTPDAEFTIGGPVNSALLNFTKALARRALEEGVRVNALCPGHIVTDRLHTRIEVHAKQHGLTLEAARESLRAHYGIHRFGEVGDIAGMVAFLCSPQASYVHGTTIVVDGGATPGL